MISLGTGANEMLSALAESGLVKQSKAQFKNNLFYILR